METEYKNNENELIIVLKGELDHHNAISIRERIEMKIATSPQKNIVFDLGELSFMDSSGISLVFNSYKAAKGIGKEITVKTDNEKFYKIFVLADIQKFVKIDFFSKEEV